MLFTILQIEANDIMILCLFFIYLDSFVLCACKSIKVDTEEILFHCLASNVSIKVATKEIFLSV